MLLKMHRQFGHPGIDVVVNILKKVHNYNNKVQAILDKIYGKCQTCKKFSPTPPRPVVSLPPASEFNQIHTMDFK